MANVSSSNGLEKRPKLRFPGFDEPYRKCRIGDIYAERSQRGAGDMELLSVTMNDGVMPRSEIEGKDNSSEDKSNYKVVCKGDMVYNSMRMWQGANGVSNYDGIVSPAYTVLMPTEEIDNQYYAALFKTSNLINEFRKNSQGLTSDTWNLKYPQIRPIRLYIPSLQEQNKISSFIGTLEERIGKQRQLVDSLKKYKRGLLRDIFSKLNVRHDKRKLKDVAVLFADGDWIESKDQAPDGIRLVQTGNVGFGVYIDKPQNAKYISEATFHRLNCLEIYDGDILISRLPEPAGRACLLPQSAERRITAVDCTVIRTDKSVIDRTYLLQFLCSDQYLKTVNSFLAGGTRQRISRKNLEGIEVPYPSIDQQRYYGSFLCKVDARITNAENRLNCLSRLRCFMLQQLFI